MIGLRYYYIILVSLFALGGCGIMPVNKGKLEGRAWCDTRYLDTVKEYQDYELIGDNVRKKLRLSKEGYIYAVAAVLPLQQNGKESEFYFSPPDRLQEIKELKRKDVSGFEAMTFVLNDDEGKPTKTIISFAGSNQWRDYLLHNFWITPIQFDNARAYVDEVLNYPVAGNLPLIATGVSLGGGLAVHVKKDNKTSKYIQEAWAFNPSNRIQADSAENPNIYLLANDYEILKKLNRENIGAYPENTSDDFDLIRSSSIYAHYRWVVTRQILHYADLAIYFETERSSDTTEPMRILQSQQISREVCTKDIRDSINNDRRIRQKNEF